MLPAQSLKSILKKLVPYHLITAAKTFHILNFEYAHLKTAKEWRCLDKQGKPIPWYTYPAIDYLEQIDASEKCVFEYGAGFSTLYWCSRAKKVISLEADRGWYDKISKIIPDNGELILRQSEEKYLEVIQQYDFNFDVIIIDGEFRSACCKHALEKLAKGGNDYF